jgi:hypothetical protein
LGAETGLVAKKFKHEMNEFLDKHYEQFTFAVGLKHIATGLYVGKTGLVVYVHNMVYVTVTLAEDVSLAAIRKRLDSLNHHDLEWLERMSTSEFEIYSSLR